jgi:SPOR domain
MGARTRPLRVVTTRDSRGVLRGRVQAEPGGAGIARLDQVRLREDLGDLPEARAWPLEAEGDHDSDGDGLPHEARVEARAQFPLARPRPALRHVRIRRLDGRGLDEPRRLREDSGVVAVAILLNQYRIQFGGLLVRWGQHLMGQTYNNALTLPRPSRTELIPPGNTNRHHLRTETSEPKLQNQKLTSAGEGQLGTGPIVVRRGPRSGHLSPALPTPNALLAPSLTAVPLFLQRSPTSIPSSETNATDANAPLERPANRILQTETSERRSASSISEMYLEVGKFKDQQQAVDTVGQLGRWGFPATTVEKGGIWTSAYHVLVGPYSSAQQFKAARKGLTQHGLQPKAFEKGSRSLTILSNLILNGAQLPSGDYTISWESYVDEVSVRFVRNHSVVTTAEGKWVKRSATYNSDAYVYRKSGDDSKDLVQILFRDMSKALDFRE